LHTKDKRQAQSLFAKLKKRYLEGKILQLEVNNQIKLSAFKDKYGADPERGDLSRKTHEADELALRLFMDVTGDISLDSIRKSHISEFKAASISRGLKPVSVNSYLRHIRAALSYAKANDFMANDPPAVKYFKLGSKLPRVIPPDDLELIKAMAKGIKPEMYRIIQFALYTGSRRTEIFNARYEHITNGDITIYGKGNKERLIPLVGKAREVLTDQDIGKIFAYEHPSTISNYYRRITRSCGVKSRFHDLRHTSATQMLKSGIPLEVVQKILGHTEIRTTQIYAKVMAETIRSELGKLSF
jgi:site-specific recombinase XerD